VFNDLTKLRGGNATRQVFGKHLGTKDEYYEEDAHNCKTPESVVRVINEYAVHREMENLFKK